MGICKRIAARMMFERGYSFEEVKSWWESVPSPCEGYVMAEDILGEK